MTTAEENNSFRRAVAGEPDVYHRPRTERGEDVRTLRQMCAEVERTDPAVVKAAADYDAMSDYLRGRLTAGLPAADVAVIYDLEGTH
jgi:hypothetical protein